MTLLLAGDIGGTKTILRLVEACTEAPLKTIHEVRYASHEFPDLVPMVRQFLEAAGQMMDYTPVPERATFAIAGPVVNQTSILTNLGWSLNAKRLEQELEISSVSLINDFEAVGYGILGLQPADIHSLQAGQVEAGAPIAVIGAGTGLGQGFLIWQADNYQVFPSEGGHADFAPRSELEFQLLKYLLDKHNIDRVSVERVVSGQGIVAIYQFLRDRQLAEESPEIAKLIRTWEAQAGQSEKTVDPAAVIAMAAMEQRDRLSERAMEIFVGAYGSEAGNLALKLLPYGGLYIAGGIAAKILPFVKKGTFLKAFLQKGRVSSVLERVPVKVILNPQVGLIGATLCAHQLPSR